MSEYIRFEDVFGPERNRDIYRLAVSQRERFTHSKTSPSRHYPDWRRSTVLYDHQIAGVVADVDREVRARLPQVLAALGIAPFDVGWMEIQLTSHNDGEYYHWHTDNGSPDTASRVVTFVYYFHAEPRPFTGGELCVHRSSGESVTVEPRNDSLIFFGSDTKHEVKPVGVPSGRFEDGRFTLNGWVRRRVFADTAGYFDGKILSVSSGRGLRPMRASKAGDSNAVAASGSAIETAAEPGTAHARRDSAPHAMALLDLYSQLHRQSARANTVDRVTELTAPAFFENYYFANRPVLIKAMMRTSPAVRHWTPELFAARYGDVPVEITDGRQSDPDYEKNFRRSVRTVKLSEFVRRVRSEPESNDCYLVARNFFFDNPALRPLRQDLQPPPDIVDTEDQGQGTAKLWLGPKGTVTPLHYDEHSVLFAQLYGRKHLKLIPSFDTPRMYVRDRYYSEVDPERVDPLRHAEFLEASVADVVVEPGDVLFLPVGWWHWAKSLSVSMSATFCSFRVSGRNTVLSTVDG